jgi:hypothetical protein
VRLVRPSSPNSVNVSGPVGEGYGTYSPVGTYALGDRVLYLDGTIPAYLIYESAQASNTGHALTDPAWWTFVSYGNQWKMFDTVSNSQTISLTGSIVAQFFATPLANTVALLNVIGSSVTVDVKVSGVTVYTQTKSLLVASDGVRDWYEYFYGDMGTRTSALFTDLPSFANQSIEVTLTGSGTVAIGTLAVGYGYYMGDTQYGLSLGIIDYSRKVADDFGQYQVVERPYSQRMSGTVTIPNARVTEISKLLADYRATPVVVIGADDFEASFVLGFIKEWELVIRYVSHSVYTIQIEGLS